jgi:hypothetical protein
VENTTIILEATKEAKNTEVQLTPDSSVPARRFYINKLKFEEEVERLFQQHRENKPQKIFY